MPFNYYALQNKVLGNQSDLDQRADRMNTQICQWRSHIFYKIWKAKKHSLLFLDRKSVNVKEMALECVVTILTGFKPGILFWPPNRSFMETVAPTLERHFKEGTCNAQENRKVWCWIFMKISSASSISRTVCDRKKRWTYIL